MEERARRERGGEVQFRKLLLPRHATISLRASNFYDEATRAGRANTQGDEILSTYGDTRILSLPLSREVTH